MRKESAFKPVDERPQNVVVIVEGAEGTGKTHFAVGVDGPVYMLGTEGGHETETAKRINPKVLHAEIYSDGDLSPSQVWFGQSFGLWRKVLGVSEEVMALPHGTVIIDSGSDLYPAVVAGLSEEMKRGDKPVPPLLYAQIYAMISGLVHRLRQKHNVVITARIKPKYDKEGNETGENKPEIWKTAPYLAEHVIRITKAKNERDRLGHVTKGALEGRTLVNPRLSDILAADASVYPYTYDYAESLRKLERVYAFCDERNVEVSKAYPSALDEIERRLSELKETLRAQVAAQTTNEG